MKDVLALLGVIHASAWIAGSLGLIDYRVQISKPNTWACRQTAISASSARINEDGTTSTTTTPVTKELACKEQR